MTSDSFAAVLASPACARAIYSPAGAPKVAALQANPALALAEPFAQAAR